MPRVRAINGKRIRSVLGFSFFLCKRDYSVKTSTKGGFFRETQGLCMYTSSIGRRKTNKRPHTNQSQKQLNSMFQTPSSQQTPKSRGKVIPHPLRKIKRMSIKKTHQLEPVIFGRVFSTIISTIGGGVFNYRFIRGIYIYISAFLCFPLAQTYIQYIRRKIYKFRTISFYAP